MPDIRQFDTVQLTELSALFFSRDLNTLIPRNTSYLSSHDLFQWDESMCQGFHLVLPVPRYQKPKDLLIQNRRPDPHFPSPDWTRLAPVQDLTPHSAWVDDVRSLFSPQRRPLLNRNVSTSEYDCDICRHTIHWASYVGLVDAFLSFCTC
jgi:hypothetical protein